MHWLSYPLVLHSHEPLQVIAFVKPMGKTQPWAHKSLFHTPVCQHARHLATQGALIQIICSRGVYYCNNAQLGARVVHGWEMCNCTLLTHMIRMTGLQHSIVCTSPMPSRVSPAQCLSSVHRFKSHCSGQEKKGNTVVLGGSHHCHKASFVFIHSKSVFPISLVLFLSLLRWASWSNLLFTS